MATKKKKPAAKKAAPAKGAQGGVRLDPDLALIPGNTATFVAEARDGRVMAKIVTARDSWMVAASGGSGDARVSRILETAGPISVTFYEDGKEYASGSWTVG